MPVQPQQPANNPAGSPQVSSGAVKVIGYVVAGGVLVILADFAPQAAVGLALVLGLGILLTHADQLTQLSSALNTALGHPSS